MPPRPAGCRRDPISHHHVPTQVRRFNLVRRDTPQVPPDAATGGQAMLRSNDEPRNEKLKKAGRTKEEPAPRVVAASWTKGQVHAATALKMLVWILVACGPIGLGLGYLALVNSSRSVVAATPAPTEPAGKQQAMELAQNAVVQWLTAHRGDEGQVVGLLPKADLPITPLRVSDPSTAEVSWRDNSWVVTVAVTVDTTTEDVASSQRRYFQIPVGSDGAGSSIVLTLPAEVAGPAVVAPGVHSYRSQVSPTDPVALAAKEFLAAMLTGVGDVTRYTAPDSTIRAIEPAPYTAVKVESAYASAPLPEVPAEGDRIDLLVRVRTEVLDEASIGLDYALSMTFRSARWEVTAIKGAPTAKPLTSPAPAIPQPSTTTN